MTTGGSAFTSGEDFVAARLSIDVPTEGIATVRELTQEIDRYRVSAEAVSRAQDDFVRYLSQSAEAANQASSAYTNLISQMQRVVEMQGHMGGAPEVGVPQDWRDPFDGAQSGTGQGRAPASVGEAQQAFDQLDARTRLNVAAQNGRLQAGDVPTSHGEQEIAQAANRVSAREQENARRQAENPPAPHIPRDGDTGGVPSTMSGMAQQLMNQFGGGGGAGGGGALGGFGTLSARGLGALGGSAAAEGGLAGGALSSLFKGGGIAAGALAGYGAFQRGGEMYQDYKNAGLIRGGGAAEGFGQDMQARLLAMNPFISTEQSRQIIQGALSEGYQGKSFDSAVDFITKNFKDMNMAQPYSALVLTPTGWARMGDLEVGSQVIAGDGSVTEVTEIHERFTEDVYEVGFSDGTSTRCTLDHLWSVYQTTDKNLRTVSLSYMLSDRRTNSRGLFQKNGAPRFRVPLTGPVCFSEADLPIDPYTLGVLLGDGSFGYDGVSVHCYEDQLHDLVLPDGVITRLSEAGEHRLVMEYDYGGTKRRHPLIDGLRELGLMGTTTHNKYIPERYLLASRGQRFALLQGLIDTDGHVDKNGNVYFTNTSEKLIADMKHLVHSLGGKVRVCTVPPKTTNSGRCYRVAIKRLPASLGAPTRLKRKADRYKPTNQCLRTKAIVSATKVAPEQCRCITVAHPTQLYVTDDFTVTHNSVSQSMELLRTNVQEGGQSIAGLSMNLSMLKEMSKDGNKTLPQLQAEFAGVSGSMIKSGWSGPTAERTASIAAGMFNGQGDMALKDVGGQIIDSFANSPGGNAMLGTMGGMDMQGLMPGAAQFLEGEHSDEIAAASMKIVRDWANRLHSQAGSPPKGSKPYANCVKKFQVFLQSRGMAFASEEGKVKKLYDDIVYEGRDPYQEGKEKADAAAESNTAVQGRNPLSAIGGGMVSRMSSELSTYKDAIGTVGTSLGDLVTGNWDDIPSRFSDLDKRARGRSSDVAAASSLNHINALDSVVQEYGRGGIEVVDANGKASRVNQNNRGQMEGLSSGSLRWREKGTDGPGMTLAQTPHGGDGFRDRVSQVQGSVTLGLTPEAQKLLAPRGGNTVRLTPHEQKVNAGYPGAYANNAPPGEDPITRGRGGW